MTLYAVPVREVFERVAYVRAESKREARQLALNPVHWDDADDPMGSGRIEATREPVREEEEWASR